LTHFVVSFVLPLHLPFGEKNCAFGATKSGAVAAAHALLRGQGGNTVDNFAIVFPKKSTWMVSTCDVIVGMVHDDDRRQDRTYDVMKSKVK